MAIKHPYVATSDDDPTAEINKDEWNEGHTVEAGTITLAMQANVATGTLGGRLTAGTGAPETLTIAAVKNAMSLANVNNTADADKPVSTLQAAADAVVLASANAHSDALVIGLLDDRGNYDASVNTFPAAGGSGTAGAILKGDIWVMSVAGTLGGAAVEIGDQVRALDDTPGQTASNWAIIERNLGFVPENVANKDASGGYPSLIGYAVKIWNAGKTYYSSLTLAAGTAANVVHTLQGRTGTLADDTDLALKAPLISPSFTTPALGTPSSGVTDNLTTTESVAAITDTDFVDETLASGGKRKILWTAVKTYLNGVFGQLTGNLSQFAAGGAIAPASIHGVTTNATTDLPVTKANLNGGTLAVSATHISAISGDLATSSTTQVRGSVFGGNLPILAVVNSANSANKKIYDIRNTSDALRVYSMTDDYAVSTEILNISSGLLAVTGDISTTTTMKAGTTIGVGGATPAATGAGITFPATQSASSDANTLDDYEEGEWTPTVSFGGASVGVTYAANAGTYIKIGNLVTGRFVCVLSSKGSSTGNTQILGLPFTVNNSNIGSAVVELANNFVTAMVSSGYCENGASSILLHTWSATGTVSATDTNFADNTRLDMWFQYNV